MKKLKDRVGLNVNLGSVEHYINEFHKFDESSMALRYPIDKKLNPSNNDTRFDIFNLHERMGELSKALEDLTYGLSNQLFESVPKDKLSNFDKVYFKLRYNLQDIIKELKGITFGLSSAIDFFSSNSHSSSADGGVDQVLSTLKKCSSDEIILLDTLFYTGRAILCNELKLPKNPYDARLDVKKRCILNMKDDGLEFGKEPEDRQINIWEKKRDSLVQNIETAMSYLDFVGDKDEEEQSFQDYGLI